MILSCQLTCISTLFPVLYHAKEYVESVLDKVSNFGVMLQCSITASEVVLRYRSWEAEGRYHYSKMFHWEPEGHYRHRHCTLIVLFWFIPEHLWILIAPFWLSTDDICYTIVHIHIILSLFKGCSWIINKGGFSYFLIIHMYIESMFSLCDAIRLDTFCLSLPWTLFSFIFCSWDVPLSRFLIVK